MDRELLASLNTTELIACAEAQGLGILSRSLSRERLIRIVGGEEESDEDDLSGTYGVREATAKLIQQYRDRITLPISKGGKTCNGDCPSYGCPEVIDIHCHRRIGR